MRHRKNHLFSAVMGLFIVVMLSLMAVPMALVLLRSWWPTKLWT